MTKDDVRKVLDQANDYLADPENGSDWIASSARHLRAFYHGLYYGLSRASPETDCKQVLLRMVAETICARAGDDLFSGTPLGKGLKVLRESLAQSLKADPPMTSRGNGPLTTSQVDAMIHCIEELDQRWRVHHDLSLRALQDIKDSTVSGRDALHTLCTVDSSFHILALGDASTTTHAA